MGVIVIATKGQGSIAASVTLPALDLQGQAVTVLPSPEVSKQKAPMGGALGNGRDEPAHNKKEHNT